MTPNVQIPLWDSAAADGGPVSPFSPNAPDTASFSTDHFRMFHFKVLTCPRGRAHDWTECPYAHPAEKARRRDPRKFLYSATACPDYRKGNCKRGDTCQFAHGVFECWLHPSRYRTHLCKDGTNCRRRVCFFAHTNDQLRLAPDSSSLSSPTSVITSSFFDSPPSSPYVHNIQEIVSSMRNVQLEDGLFSGLTRCVFGSTSGGILSGNGCEEEEPAMERVESGRDIRARIYAKLSRENSIAGSAPHVGWVSEPVNGFRGL
ncbi:zinc finger CCCH domain-containing protein 23-like [Vigna umbellata]|uniref:zinc finger CCCH domain-containing protein 23-like n=1 Tax=Vigna umbellata TaxID=87088 RepID=UPI001F5F54FE|nr:zinc finger CCCH domain-containing protein 23-like [Vigna umbellata]